MPRPWYSTFGPVDWYRHPHTGRLEWFRVSLSWGHRLFLHLTVWPWRAWHLVLLARVLSRSMYGRPSSYDTRFSFPALPQRPYRMEGFWTCLS